MQTSFPRSYLAAALTCASKQDVRYYLNGVFVESLKNETRLTCTDGSVVACLRRTGKNDEIFSLIIPRAIVEIALKIKSEVFSLVKSAAGWSLAGISFEPIEGKFPDYRHVIPAKFSGEAGDYDPELLIRFVKAAKELKLKTVPIVRHSGKSSALVHFYGFDEFVGIISPYRHFTEKCYDLGMPTWGAEYPK